MTQDVRHGLYDSPSKYPPRSPAKRRRVRSPHPGVVLLPPEGEHRSWRARYVDLSGKTRKVTLERIDSKTAETRKAWAVRLSEQLQRARSDTKAGVLRGVEAVHLSGAVARFFEAHPRLSPGTRRSYGAAIATLIDGRERLTTAQLTPALLTTWRTERARALKRAARSGGGRGEKRTLSRLRSPFSVNKEIRSVSVILEYWRSSGMLRLTRDDIADALRKERVALERREFLEPDQIRALLAACASHDAETFELTRDGSRNTPRYKPIAPFVRFLLLTGMRLAEALAIEWRDVQPERIHVRASISKTKRARYVDLTVAPSALPARTNTGEGRVFELTAGEVHAARKRLVDLKAPEWSPHALRRTCSTFFTNAFNAWRSSKSVGHSVTIAERHYAGLVRVPTVCTTLEQAMGLTGAAPQSNP